MTFFSETRDTCRITGGARKWICSRGRHEVATLPRSCPVLVSMFLHLNFTTILASLPSFIYAIFEGDRIPSDMSVACARMPFTNPPGRRQIVHHRSRSIVWMTEALDRLRFNQPVLRSHKVDYTNVPDSGPKERPCTAASFPSNLQEATAVRTV